MVPSIGLVPLPVPVARFSTEPEGALALVLKSVPADEIPPFDLIPYTIGHKEWQEGYDKFADAWRWVEDNYRP